MRSCTTKATAPNTRRIGCAKLSAVYCVAGLASGKPQSHARRPTQSVGSEAMDDAGGQRGRDGDKQEHEKPVVGAAALGDRRDRKPRDPGLRRHPAADETAHRRRQSVDEQTRKNSGERDTAPQAHTLPRGKSDPSRARVCAAFVRGRPRKVMPNALAKHAAASAADKREQRPDRRRQYLQPQDGNSGLSKMA